MAGATHKDSNDAMTNKSPIAGKTAGKMPLPLFKKKKRVLEQIIPVYQDTL